MARFSTRKEIQRESTNAAQWKAIAEVARSVERATLSMLHYSKRTERAYIDWITRFIPIEPAEHRSKSNRSDRL
jgi:hypothetical protein